MGHDVKVSGRMNSDLQGHNLQAQVRRFRGCRACALLIRPYPILHAWSDIWPCATWATIYTGNVQGKFTTVPSKCTSLVHSSSK